jgi:primosomal protein N' (replication factor Y)
VHDRPLARVEVVDMRQDFRSRGEADPVSQRLEALLLAGLERGEQSLLLLNRRGYATFVLCRECGAVLSCPRCSVSLVLHRREGRLRCHYCDHARALPGRCPECDGEHLHWGGTGTQRLEERLRSRLGGGRLVRLDRDAVRRRGEAERILTGFASGEWDVLLGTQMVAKGHDFPRVTLVGVLAAESTLCLPDFRAAERTFHLLTQVVGRAGRGDAPGRAVIQTFQPDHYAIQHACAQDHEAFYRQEIRFRKLLQHPPFTVLANLVVSRSGAREAQGQAGVLAGDISRRGEGYLRVVGPAPAPLARLRGKHRFQILVKARARGRLLEVLRASLEAHRASGHPDRHVTVDVDPVSLL